MNRAKASFFDGQVSAPWAADEYGPDEVPKVERLFTRGELAVGQRVLEPGCGTGRLTRLLGELVGRRGRVVAMDISRSMIEACRQRVAHMPQVEVHHAALEDMPATTGGYHRIVCHQVFPHFDDQAAAAARMAELLEPGGLLLVAHFISQAEVNDLHRKAGTAVERDLLPSPDDMRRLMREAGLTLLTLVDDELGYFLKARREGLSAGTHTSLTSNSTWR